MNGIMEIRRQVRLSQWSAMVSEREESGLSVKAYCKQTGIAAKTYYYRLRKLREAAVEQARFEATQPELVQFTPPAEYAVGQAQSKLDSKQLSLSLYNIRRRQNTLSDKRKALSSRLLTQPLKFR